MLTALVRTGDGVPGWQLQTLDDAGAVTSTPRKVGTLAALATEWAAAKDHRWLWDSTADGYPELLAGGLTVARCHDITVTERILLGRDGRHGEPAAAAAIVARVAGLPVPPDAATGVGVPALFDVGTQAVPATDRLTVLRAAYVEQLRRIGTDGPLKLLVAAESASALAAAELARTGLPLDGQVHAAQLTELLGERPPTGARPAVLESLADLISAAFGFPVHPDSPTDLREAFRRCGFDLSSTRAGVIRQIDHPAVPALLDYKELSRLFAANGWQWLAEWVRDGRFHAEYIAGGVVSGRWATRGGGGLQIPKIVRRAVIAEPGKIFVVADAAQLEPRVLAAVSGDPALEAVSDGADLYTALAADGFGGDRAHAKLAMLGAMYGQSSGEAGRLLPTLRRRYPQAVGFLEDAAHRGEQGGTVRSVLGRTSPKPDPLWWSAVRDGAMPDATPTAGRRARETARAWGRFTRNFVVQASAADWAAVWLSTLRRELRAVPAAELVLFQHDELVVHVAENDAEQVADLAVAAAATARRLVFPSTGAVTPVHPAIVRCYADAK